MSTLQRREMKDGHGSSKKRGGRPELSDAALPKRPPVRDVDAHVEGEQEVQEDADARAELDPRLFERLGSKTKEKNEIMH